MAVWLLAAALSFVDGRLVVFDRRRRRRRAWPRRSCSATCATPPGAGSGSRSCSAARRSSSPTTRTHAAGDFVFIPALFAIAWLAGFALRERAAQAEAAEERAAHAEREREAAARIAVAEERARIARELHDIVAHAVSVMVLQVGAVRHRLPPSARRTREALRGVERTGRTALAEMRRLLGAHAPATARTPSSRPSPGSTSSTRCSDDVRPRRPARASCTSRASPSRCPRAIDLSAYRIVQEGLTNALKHARAEPGATCVIRYAPDELRIEVRDDGARRGAAATASATGSSASASA